MTVGNDPSAVAVDPRTHTVYVTNVGDNTVSVINGRTCNGHVLSGCDQTPATVPVGALPLGVFVDPRTRSVYVENFDDGTVSVLDASTCNGTHQAGCPASPLPTFGVGVGPGDVDVNQTTHTGYVATETGLSVFDTHTCNATTRSGCDDLGDFAICQGCLGPWSAKVDVAHNTIYEGDGESTIAAIDGRSCNADDLSGCATAPFGKVTLPDPGFDHILFLALDVRRHTVYAVRQKDDAIVGFDTDACNGHRRAACSKVRRLFVHVGTEPQGIALDPSMHTLYVGNQVDDTVSLVDTLRCNADRTAGCRHRPPTTHAAPTGGIVVDPATDTAYATTRHDSVAMVDTRSCRAFHTNGCHRHWPTVPVGHGARCPPPGPPDAHALCGEPRRFRHHRKRHGARHTSLSCASFGLLGDDHDPDPGRSPHVDRGQPQHPCRVRRRGHAGRGQHRVDDRRRRLQRGHDVGVRRRPRRDAGRTDPWPSDPLRGVVRRCRGQPGDEQRLRHQHRRLRRHRRGGLRVRRCDLRGHPTPPAAGCPPPPSRPGATRTT